MKPKLWLAALSALAIVGLAWLGRPYQSGGLPGPRPAAERPILVLLTSLPLVFGERFSLDRGGSPALTRLEQRYRVVPIAVADEASLTGKRLLFMAQPRAQPSEALVELDQWVRGGGHILLLADPRLDWPSERALGDVLRPPPMFADTGLLAHWGLKLSAPGSLASNGPCTLADRRTMARCQIGRGRVTVIADADFVNVDDPDDAGLDRLTVELGRLETR